MVIGHKQSRKLIQLSSAFLAQSVALTQLCAQLTLNHVGTSGVVTGCYCVTGRRPRQEKFSVKHFITWLTQQFLHKKKIDFVLFFSSL